jgi:hypothetical protein
MGDFQLSDYQDALDLFNETVANMTRMVEESHADIVNQLNAYQASGTMDSSDMGAYNLTMYGVDSVHSVHSEIIGSVGNVSNYYINNSTPVMAAQTENTSMSTSLVGHFLSDPTSILPTHDTGTMMVWVIFAVLLGMFFFMYKR